MFVLFRDLSHPVSRRLQSSRSSAARSHSTAKPAGDRRRLRRPHRAAATLLTAVALIGGAVMTGSAAATAATPGAPVVPAGAATARLGNGTELVVGGCAPGHCPSVVTTATIYDPATGRAVPTGRTRSPHGYATLTVLASGKALLVGGCQGRLCGQPNPGAELWDPATGQWTATGALAADQAGLSPVHASAVLLATGQVLVAGGLNFSATAQLWDPTTGTWRRTAAMRAARESFSLTRLASGQVLAAGGCDGYYCQSVLASAELYDPSSDRWTSTGTLRTARYDHTAVLQRNDSVRVTGGTSASSSPVTTAEVWNPATGTWAPAGG